MAVLSIRQFAPLMTQTVAIAPWTGYDAYGQPSWGSDVTYKAAVIGEIKLVRDKTGQTVPSKQRVYLMGAPAIGPEDRVTLSTGDVGSTEQYAIRPPILAVGRYPFTVGQFFTEVSL